jgi:maspardin
MADVSRSVDYQSFRSSVPLRKIIVDDDGERAWSLYDAGPKSVRCPVLFLPPASGRADVFFRQILALSAAGYRVIGVEYPVYWTLKEWCEGFRKLLDHLQLDKIHVYGASLGGFLAQKFAEYTHISPRVHSIILGNSFVDTTVFQQTSSAPTFWMMPAIVLKKMVMGNFDKGLMEKDIAESIDFMVTSLDSLGQQELASRLTLNCMNAYVEPQKLKEVVVTVMDVNDECALSQAVKDELYKCYPEAKRAHLKDGGNFPYLSRAAEVNVYIQIHLRQFWDSRYSAMEPSRELTRQLREAEDQGPSSSQKGSGTGDGEEE